MSVSDGGGALPADTGAASQASSAGLLFVLRALSAGLTLAMQMLLARVMQQEDYGTYLLVWTWLLLLVNFTSAGFPDSALRFVPRYHQRARKSDLSAFFESGLVFVVAGSVAFSALLTGAALLFVDDATARLVLLFLAAGLPFLSLEYYLEGIARGFGWYMLTTAPTYIARPLIIAVGTLVFVLLGQAITARLAGFMLLASLIAVSCVLLVVVWRRLGAITSGAPHKGNSGPRRRHWLLASLPLLVVSGFDDLLTYSDVVLIGMLASPEEVALYFAAARTMALASFVHYAFYMVAGRGFSLALTAHDHGLLQQRILHATRLTVWSTLAAVALTLAAGPLVLAMFGSAFRDGYAVMVILAAGFIARSLAGQSPDLLAVLGHAKVNILIGGGAIAFNIVLSVLLIPALGIEGAALATAATMMLRAGASIWFTKRLAGLDVVDCRFPLGRHRKSA